MSTIGLWFDGGGPYGFGNVRRSTELGEFLARRGHDVRFTPLSDRAAALCPQPRSPLSRADVIVLDVPYNTDAFVAQARTFGVGILALDFDGTAPPDVVISLQDLRPVPAESQFLCGVEYSIIREDIRSLGIRHETTDEVLVIVGGGDQDGLTQRIVEHLPEVPVCVVQGPMGAPLQFERPGLRVVINPPDLPQLMARCAWAVTTGGTTMLEMLCLGKAIHVVPRTKEEWAFARRFADQSALLDLGLETLQGPTPAHIIACQQCGPQLIDGRGCERIAAAIETLL